MTEAVRDAVVVGAGPAGLLVAVQLAAAGLAVTVVERREAPADGLLLLPGGAAGLLEEAGLDPAALGPQGAAPASTFELVTPRERHALPLEGPLWALPRRAALERLARAAAEAGAEVLWRWRAEVPLWEGRRVAGVRCLRPGEAAAEVRARAVVDASGPATFLAGAVGQLMPRRGRPRRAVTARAGLDLPARRCELHIVDRAWSVVAPCGGATVRAVMPGEDDGPGAIPLAGRPLPRDAVEVLDARRTVGVLTRAQAGDGWVAVGSAAGRGAPGAPGATASGLEVAAAAAVELGPALARGRPVGAGLVGATVALARQAAHLESALARTLEAAAAAGVLGWAAAHPARARCLAGMLLGEWSGRRDRLRRYLVLWRLGRLARRVQ